MPSTTRLLVIFAFLISLNFTHSSVLKPQGVVPASTQLLPRNEVPFYSRLFVNNPFYGKTQTIAQTKQFFHVDAKKQPAKELRYFEPLFDYSDGDIIVGKEPSEKRSAGTELTIPEGFKIYEAVPSKEEPTSSY